MNRDNNINGILILNKPVGCTSHDAVNAMRKLLGTKKIGHTGTLDPIATGVLPVLIGNATKMLDIIMSRDKKYRAKLTLGLTTDTMDITGNILKQSNVIPSEYDVIDAARNYEGQIEQVPPIYSAIKVGGKKLYEYAREGIDIKPEPRKVKIYSIEVKKISEHEYMLDVHCSKGTYIRSLCNDIGESLGCGGVMSALERTSSGGFDISEAIAPCELEKMATEKGTESVKSIVIPPEKMLKKIFPEIKSITLDGYQLKLAKNGAAVHLSKIRNINCDNVAAGDRIMMYDSVHGFFALGEICIYNNELSCKPVSFL